MTSSNHKNRYITKSFFFLNSKYFHWATTDIYTYAITVMVAQHLKAGLYFDGILVKWSRLIDIFIFRCSRQGRYPVACLGSTRASYLTALPENLCRQYPVLSVVKVSQTQSSLVFRSLNTHREYQPSVANIFLEASW